MHSRYMALGNEILAWARSEENVEGIIVIGSQARSEPPADEWSDLDCMVLVNDPHHLLDDDSWTRRFGDVVCVFNYVTPLHFTDWNWCVKRILLTNNRDIDFSILPFNRLDEVLTVNREIMSKGYRVLYDSRGDLLISKTDTLVSQFDVPEFDIPTQQELRNDLHDVLFHIIWSFKKIKRGELWVAVDFINNHIRNLLLKLIECHNLSTGTESNTIRYDGRFLEKRTDSAILDKLALCFTKYDELDAINTLGHLIDVVFFVSKALFEAYEYPFDPSQFDHVRMLYNDMRENTHYEKAN